MKQLKCDDVLHNGCTFVATGDSDESVIGQLKEHGMGAHPDDMGGDEEEMMGKMKAAITDVDGGMEQGETQSGMEGEAPSSDAPSGDMGGSDTGGSSDEDKSGEMM